eukprot:GHVP01005272.1.p2 GENE.GHVP01005272.1~~GHVP01005272.1.p2  ORF type:complete len:161 (+),score=26.91 GHVP01005272.1:1584-2066(+)
MGSEITPEVFNTAELFIAKNIEILELHNKAFYFLRKIIEGVAVGSILIDPKDFEIDHEIVRNMDSIEIKQKTRFSIHICDKALCVLEKIKASWGVCRLEMDTKHSDFDIGGIEDIRRIGEIDLWGFSLYHKAINLFGNQEFIQNYEFSEFLVDTGDLILI